MSTATAIHATDLTGERLEPRPIPLARVMGVELRKMFDTRSGFWLLISIAVTSALATGATILWAPDTELTYKTFAAAIGFPMSVILPMIAILAVTSEWSQRSGLTTFTLVPHRGRVLLAKALSTIAVGVASMIVALLIGALGNVVGTAITGTPTVWNDSAGHLAEIVLGTVLGMLLGFTLGVVVRSSAPAIVGYFVLTLVLPPLSSLLAGVSTWWSSARPWIDVNDASGALFRGHVGAQDWYQVASTTGIWIVVPLVVGLVLLFRSEVK